MKTYAVQRLLPAMALLLLFASCKKKNEEGKSIPKDAALVFRMNPVQLASKLPVEKMMKNPLWNDIMTDNNNVPPLFQKILSNPTASGIDYSSDVFLFVEKDSRSTYVAIE